MCVGIERSHQLAALLSMWFFFKNLDLGKTITLTVLMVYPWQHFIYRHPEHLILAFIVGAFDADWSKVGHKPAHSRNPVLREDTSGCSPGKSRAISAPPRSGVACGRLKGVHPFCSQSISLCSSKQPEISSCGPRPPKCSFLVGRLKGILHFLLAQSPCQRSHLNSIALHCIMRHTSVY